MHTFSKTAQLLTVALATTLGFSFSAQTQAAASATQVIEKASFESYGCAANIATSSIVTEMIKGLTLEQAWNEITWKKVTEEIGGLPSVKFHCGVLAVGALKRAIRQYFTQKGVETPSWLPKEHTFEEKQALEEEELAKTLSKRLKPEAEKQS